MTTFGYSHNFITSSLLNKLMPSNTPAQPPSGFDPAKLYVWVKGLESKVNNLLREVDLIKNDFIKKQNNVKKDLKTVNDDLLELKRNQDKMLEKMDLIIKELQRTAAVEEVQVIKKYLEFWNPMTFVTQRDLDRAIQARMEKMNIPPAVISKSDAQVMIPSTSNTRTSVEKNKKEQSISNKKGDR